VQPSTKMYMLIKVQPWAMEIDMSALGAIEAKRCVIIMDRATFLDKGIFIPNLD